MKRTTSTREADRKALRRIAREQAKANDPWFGRRRKTSMEGDRRKAANKAACRGRVTY